jgi:uncharacterized protein YgiM (DUF1202 family)
MNPSPACTHRITADYQAAYPDPIRVRAGEPVTVSDRREQSEGHTWVWCTDARGKSGWVPQTYLEPHASGWIIPRDYDAAELSVQTGETVAVITTESGWCWATNAHGHSGWLPASHATPLPNPPDHMV